MMVTITKTNAEANIKFCGTLLLLACFLLSCSNKQSHWAFDQVHSGQKEFRSTKLTYSSQDPLYGIDMEFLHTEKYLNVYLNVHSIPVVPNKEDPKNTPFTIQIEGETSRCLAYPLAGGQRFLLPQDTVNTLIEALAHNKEVSISLFEYSAVFKPEDFPSKFEKLLHPFLIQNPFHLPF